MPLAAVAGIGAAGSIFGGLFGASSAKKAAQAQADAANHAADLQHQDAQEALAFQKQQYGDSQRNMAPWLNTGASSISRLRSLMGLDGPDLLTPGSTASEGAFPSSVPGRGTVIDGGDPGGKNVNRFAQFDANGNFGVMDPSSVPAPPAGGGDTINPPGVPPPSSSQVFNRYAGPLGMAQSDPQAAGLAPNSGPTGISAQDSPAPASPTGNPADGSSGGLATSDTSPPIGPNPPAPVPAPTGGNGANASPFPTGATGNLDKGWDVGFQAPNAITEQNDPGYKFRLEQGQKLLENSAAAAGTVGGGAVSKALNRYGQDYASNEYGNVYNRSVDQYERAYNVFNNNQNTRFNRYATLAGYGQTAASNLNSGGVQTANNLSSLLMNSGAQIGQNINNAGAARASGYVGAGNAYGGMANNMSNLMQQYMLYQQMNGGK